MRLLLHDLLPYEAIHVGDAELHRGSSVTVLDRVVTIAPGGSPRLRQAVLVSLHLLCHLTQLFEVEIFIDE